MNRYLDGMLEKVIGFGKTQPGMAVLLKFCLFARGGDFRLPVNRSLTVAALFLAAGLAQGQPTNVSVTPASIDALHEAVVHSCRLPKGSRLWQTINQTSCTALLS